MPAASMPKSKYTRLCVIHKNVPSIISKITTVLSDNQINIENMVNSSKQEMAYTMMDVSGTVSDSVTDILTAEDGIIRIRVI